MKHDGHPRRACADLIAEHHGEAPVGDHTVTVAVSLFNYARFLEDCLESVRTQTHRPLELIVVDDASSSDDSLQVACAWIEKHADRFSRATLLRHRDNQGLAQARNTAFAHARTETVFVLDADNQIHPRAIARLHEALDGVSFAAAYSQLEFFGEQRGLGLADYWSPAKFVNGNYVDAMALIRRDAWQDVGGYTHIEGGWEDFDFWCKLVDADLLALFVPEVLCRYRVHGTSMLRTDTAASERRLKVELTLRHPWLSLY